MLKFLIQLILFIVISAYSVSFSNSIDFVNLLHYMGYDDAAVQEFSQIADAEDKLVDVVSKLEPSI